MINSNEAIVVRVPVSPAMLRSNGGDMKCFRLAQGFCWAEYPDGNVFPISNPLEQWLLGVRTNADNTYEETPIYFKFVAEGKRPNPGQDDEGRSISDIETVL